MLVLICLFLLFGLFLFVALFLDAPLLLYKRVCPSVGPSIGPSVRRQSVRRFGMSSLKHVLGASYAVYLALLLVCLLLFVSFLYFDCLFQGYKISFWTR